MKRKERSFFSKRRKDEAPAIEAMPFAPEAQPVATVRVGQALLFAGAPEAMPIVDDQLFLYMGPQGGLAIGPQCEVPPMLVLWREGDNWLVRRLCQGTLLCNGFETMGDSPILLQDGVRMELVGVCAFTFQEIREPAPVAEEPAVIPEPVPATAPAAAEEPETAPEPVGEEKSPFDWTPFFPVEEPETVAEPIPATVPAFTPDPEPVAEPGPIPETVPAAEPEVAPEPIPAEDPEVMAIPATEPMALEEPETIAEPEPAAEPEPVAEAPVEKPDIAAELALAEEAPFEWKPCYMDDEPETDPDPVRETEPEIVAEPIPVAEPEIVGEAVAALVPEVVEEPVPVTEPEPVAEAAPEEDPDVTAMLVRTEEAPFDWKPYDFAGEEDIVPDPVHEMEPERIPVEPVTEELPVQVSCDPLVAALERLAAGDPEALQELPGLLAQKDLYCWGGFNFLGVYLQPIPAVRPADWSGDADALDDLGWEPRPGMVIPVFTCEEEAVKRDCPLGAFPSAAAPALFAHFAETGLDLELDPFGTHPVRIPAAAVRELSETLGGSPEKFRWIRRTLPW